MSEVTQWSHPLTSGLSHSRPQSLRSFWPAARIESFGSNHFVITKEITKFCPSGLTQSVSMAHAWNGCSQSSRFLPQASRIVGSGDENGSLVTARWQFTPVAQLLARQQGHHVSRLKKRTACVGPGHIYSSMPRNQTRNGIDLYFERAASERIKFVLYHQHKLVLLETSVL